MGAMWQDLRFATRMLARKPGFTLIAVLTLALGIGANTAIFSVVYATLLRPLPFPEAGQLVHVTGELTKRGAADIGLSAPELFDFEGRDDIFSSVAGLYPINANLTGVDRPERVEVLLAGADYFTLLGARAQIGRLFTAEDALPGIGEVVVLSDAIWRRRFGADPGVIGHKVRLDNDLFTVIGVMPRDFRHPRRTLQVDVEMFVPAGYRATPFSPNPSRFGHFLDGAFARLRPGVTPAIAQAQLDSLAAELRREYADVYPDSLGWRLRVVPLQEDLTERVRPAMSLLMGAVGLVLLIACANVANLVLTRALERAPELAVRQALGAGRGRLLRQMITESGVVAALGGGLGFLLAVWGLDGLLVFVPDWVPRLSEVRIDSTVLIFTVLASLATTLLVGVAPALRACKVDVYQTLREGGKSGGSMSRSRMRGLLLGAEVAIALVLLAGAGLLIRSFLHLQAVEPGFDTRHLLTAQLWLPQPNDPSSGPYFEHTARLTFYRSVLERLRALPGVEHAAITSQIPLAFYRAPVSLEIEGHEESGTPSNFVQNLMVSTEYFETMRIPLLRGRTFNSFDVDGGERVVLVSEAAAKAYWPGDDPVGKRVRYGSRAPWMRVAGVVGDVRNRRLSEPAPPTLYRPLEQVSSLSMGFVVRTATEPLALAEPLRAQVEGVDAEVPVFAVRSMDQVLWRGMAQRRFLLMLLGIFAAGAMALAMGGIYAVVSYSVTQRTHEIGIRMALGAQPADLVRLTIGDAARPVALGLFAGTLAAAGLARFMKALLYGVTPTDTVTYVAVALTMGVVALLAAYLPARKAVVIDPLVALRHE